MHTHLIFDFGGVILLFGSDAGQGKKTTSIPDDLASILGLPLPQVEEYWRSEKAKLIKGVETPHSFLQRIIEENVLSIDVQTALIEWEVRYALSEEKINWELLRKIENLKSKYHISLLTDAINLSRGEKGLIHRIDEHFDSFFRSYEQKLKKPDPAAYTNVLQTLHVSPEKCVFVDDVEENIQAANDLGITGLLYRDNSQLFQQFSRLGIEN